MEPAYFSGIVLFSCFVQAAVGFGLPMIAMPLLVPLFGIRLAAPLMAIIILQLQIVMVTRYRESLNLKTVAHITVAAVFGIPVGVLLLSRLPESITVPVLGLVLVFYVISSAARLPLPTLENPSWAYLFGFLGGLGAGAYNMAAPPMIIYGDIKGWPPQEFKSNLQGYFLIITIITIITHTLNGNMTTEVLEKSALAIPFVIIGALIGFYQDRFLKPDIFRKVVLGLLLILGLNLIL
jgi:uncharacterized membrane protein YfcA